MLIIISPSKTQDFQAHTMAQTSLPRQRERSAQLVAALKQYNAQQLSQLMGVSDKLAALNYERFQDFSTEFSTDNAKQALLAFKGDVYQGIKVDQYQDEDFNFAQQHLRILSGLYGVLRPLDLIQPYRLEMSTKLNNKAGNNLYQFWGSTISDVLNQDESDCIVNLASNEYFKAVDKQTLRANVIDIVFKENRDGNYKTIGLFAKRARGMMSHYAITNRITDAELLKHFNDGNYQFNPNLSNQSQWVFSR